MPDNVTDGSSHTFGTYFDGTAHHPGNVLEFVTGGSAGAWTTQRADSNSGSKSAGTLRVVLATDQPQLTNALKVDGSGATQPVSAVGLPLPTGAATESTLSALGGKVTACDTGAVVIASGAVTANAGTGTFAVAGTVAVSNFPTGFLVSGTVAVSNLPATQPVSGTVTANAGTGTFAVSAASLPLPTGASTEATLSTLNGKVTACNTGAVVVSSGTIAATQSGTWNVGTVTTVSAVTAITNALPAGPNLIGQVGAYPQTDAVYSGNTSLTPQFAKISCAASGDNTLVAGVTNKKIRVLSLLLVANGAVNVYFRDNTAGTAICADGTNPIPLTAQGSGFALQQNNLGHMQSSTGNPLVLNLSSAVAVSGCLTYVAV